MLFSNAIFLQELIITNKLTKVCIWQLKILEFGYQGDMQMQKLPGSSESSDVVIFYTNISVTEKKLYYKW